jgi:cytoskeletal protein RodZ
MTIEGLGKKFQQARLARKMTLDEAARMTKIRPSRLAEIEADDFSNFPSLAYAKGFLLIYGKFLEVDVSSYMEAFETSNAVTVDGYSYLQDNPAPKAPTPVIRAPRNRTSLLPLAVGIIVLVVGFSLIKLILDISRIAPPRKQAGVQPTPTATATPAAVVAPRALPADTPTPGRVTASTDVPAPTITPLAQSTPPPPPTPSPTPTEPEIRRAEPVRPEDLVAAGIRTNASPARPVNRVEILALRRTHVEVTVDNGSGPGFERWIYPTDGPLRVQGQQIAVRVLDPEAVVIRKNGKRISDGDPDVTID